MQNPSAVDVDALFKQASALHLSGRLHEAIPLYRHLLARFPDSSKLLNNLGKLAIQTGNLQEGIGLLRRAIKIDPMQAVAYFNLGDGLRQAGQRQKALRCYDRSIALQPGNAMAHYHRGLVFESGNNFAAALACCDMAVSLNAANASFHNTRANLLLRLGRFEQALASYDHALALKADYVEAHCNRGHLFQNLHRNEEALACFDHAIALKPDFAHAYLHKSLLTLAMGDYRQGWSLYEWRWKCAAPSYVRHFSEPLWLGEQPLAGKTLLVYAEAGLGDVIQFARYLPLVEALGARVVLEVPASMLSLAATLSRGNLQIVENGQTLPAFDLQCPIMSLPLAFKTTLATIPSTFPYLFEDKAKRELWRERLGDKKTARVGLVWSGRVGAEIDFNPCRNRSLPFECLQPLLQLPLAFHCLQKDIRPHDAARLADFPQVALHQGDLHDFSDTAALIAEMDLVISIDTSVAHLAGAMGKPLWVLLPFATDFRWTLKESATPWYPAATLFRQPTIGDWTSPVAEVTQRLQDMRF